MTSAASSSSIASSSSSSGRSSIFSGLSLDPGIAISAFVAHQTKQVIVRYAPRPPISSPYLSMACVLAPAAAAIVTNYSYHKAKIGKPSSLRLIFDDPEDKRSLQEIIQDLRCLFASLNVQEYKESDYEYAVDNPKENDLKEALNPGDLSAGEILAFKALLSGNTSFYLIHSLPEPKCFWIIRALIFRDVYAGLKGDRTFWAHHEQDADDLSKYFVDMSGDDMREYATAVLCTRNEYYLSTDGKEKYQKLIEVATTGKMAANGSEFAKGLFGFLADSLRPPIPLRLRHLLF